MHIVCQDSYCLLSTKYFTKFFSLNKWKLVPGFVFESLSTVDSVRVRQIPCSCWYEQYQLLYGFAVGMYLHTSNARNLIYYCCDGEDGVRRTASEAWNRNFVINVTQYVCQNQKPLHCVSTTRVRVSIFSFAAGSISLSLFSQFTMKMRRVIFRFLLGAHIQNKKVRVGVDNVYETVHTRLHRSYINFTRLVVVLGILQNGKHSVRQFTSNHITFSQHEARRDETR